MDLKKKIILIISSLLFLINNTSFVADSSVDEFIKIVETLQSRVGSYKAQINSETGEANIILKEKTGSERMILPSEYEKLFGEATGERLIRARIDANEVGITKCTGSSVLSSQQVKQSLTALNRLERKVMEKFYGLDGKGMRDFHQITNEITIEENISVIQESVLQSSYLSKTEKLVHESYASGADKIFAFLKGDSSLKNAIKNCPGIFGKQQLEYLKAYSELGSYEAVAEKFGKSLMTIRQPVIDAFRRIAVLSNQLEQEALELRIIEENIDKNIKNYNSKPLQIAWLRLTRASDGHVHTFREIGRIVGLSEGETYSQLEEVKNKLRASNLLPSKNLTLIDLYNKYWNHVSKYIDKLPGLTKFEKQVISMRMDLKTGKIKATYQEIADALTKAGRPTSLRSVSQALTISRRKIQNIEAHNIFSESVIMPERVVSSKYTTNPETISSDYVDKEVNTGRSIRYASGKRLINRPIGFFSFLPIITGPIADFAEQFKNKNKVKKLEKQLEENDIAINKVTNGLLDFLEYQTKLDRSILESERDSFAHCLIAYPYSTDTGPVGCVFDILAKLGHSQPIDYAYNIKEHAESVLFLNNISKNIYKKIRAINPPPSQNII